MSLLLITGVLLVKLYSEMTSLRGMLVLTVCFAILSDNTEDKQCTPRYDQVGFTELSGCNEMFTLSTFSLFMQITFGYNESYCTLANYTIRLFILYYFTGLMMMTSPTPVLSAPYILS